jgi:hypothetical protein
MVGRDDLIVVGVRRFICPDRPDNSDNSAGQSAASAGGEPMGGH